MFVCLWVVSVCFLFYFVLSTPSVFSFFTSCLCDCLHQSSCVPPVFNPPGLPCVYISLCASPCPCWFLVLMSVLSLSLCFISCARVPCFFSSLVSFPPVLCVFQFILFCEIPLFVVFSLDIVLLKWHLLFKHLHPGSICLTKPDSDVKKSHF